MIRDLGFISWKDPNAWMEKMKGERWDTLVKKENTRFLKMLEKVASKDEILEKVKQNFKSFDKKFAHLPKFKLYAVSDAAAVLLGLEPN